MQTWDKLILETIATEATKKNYELYHETYSSAIKEAGDYAEANGYKVDDDDHFNQVAAGPRKPSRDETVRHSIKLTKDGKVQRKALQIQVYNRGTDKKPYELNCYIS
jgi:hypothetical protein